MVAAAAVVYAFALAPVAVAAVGDMGSAAVVRTEAAEAGQGQEQKTCQDSRKGRSVVGPKGKMRTGRGALVVAGGRRLEIPSLRFVDTTTAAAAGMGTA